MTSALNNALRKLLSSLYKQKYSKLDCSESAFCCSLRQAQTDNDKKIETESRTELAEKHRKLLFQKNRKLTWRYLRLNFVNFAVKLRFFNQNFFGHNHRNADTFFLHVVHYTFQNLTGSFIHLTDFIGKNTI